MPVSLKKGQKVSLTKGNPGLKNVVVGIGWDINAFDSHFQQLYLLCRRKEKQQHAG